MLKRADMISDSQRCMACRTIKVRDGNVNGMRQDC